MASTLTQRADLAWLALEFVGAVAFAISAGLAAQRRGRDVFGVAWLGLVVGVGGGTLRDVLLGTPAHWLGTPLEAVLAALAGLGAALLVRAELVSRWASFRWADGVGLATLCIASADAALARGMGPFVAVALGILCGCGGGVLRDALLRRRLLLLTEEFYVTAALLGAALHVFFVHTPLGGPRTFWLSLAVVLALRSVGMRGGWVPRWAQRRARSS